jgi:extradiol dioxygenase family protein
LIAGQPPDTISELGDQLNMRNRLLLSLATLAALTGSFGCVNLFDPIDNPGGDVQLLSAARAAFDRGDIANARELYAKVAGETGRAEEIFLDLDSCGADIAAFGTALSKASQNSAAPGIMFSVMGEHMYPAHSTTCFATLLAAFKRARALNDTSLRGFASFMASVAIAGEVFANNAGAVDGTITKADVFTDPTSCIASCGAPCAKTDGIVGAAEVTLTSATTITATWGTLQGSLRAMNTALGELGITSSSPSINLYQAMQAVSPLDAGSVYRCALAQIGVGR